MPLRTLWIIALERRFKNPMPSTWPLFLAILASLGLVRYALTRARPASAAKREGLKQLRETLDSLSLTLFLVFFVVQPFIARAYVIPTGSMQNTLPIGTRILASPLAPRVVPVRAGDVLVFHAPPLALSLSSDQTDDVWIKRCIGVAGQTIEIKRNVLWRDGKIVAEPYAIWKSPSLPPANYDLKIVRGAVYSRSYDASGAAGLWTQAEVPVANQSAISSAKSGKVPDGFLLLLGDHRNGSLDGHVWGFLPRQSVIGRAFASFWPPNQAGTINR